MSKKKKKQEQSLAVPLTMLEVAQQIDPDADDKKLALLLRSVQKWRKQLELGTPFHRSFLLTQVDADQIKQHVKPAPGNPAWVKSDTSK